MCPCGNHSSSTCQPACNRNKDTETEDKGEETSYMFGTNIVLVLNRAMIVYSDAPHKLEFKNIAKGKHT